MYSIAYGDKEIKFHIKRKNVKNINLTVRPNLEVFVSANKKVPLKYIKEFVHSKAAWIEKHLNYYGKIQGIDQAGKEYVNGQSFRYLGKQYRLKVFQSDKEEVKYFRGYIHIYTKDLYNVEKKEKLMEDWYRKRSEIIFKDSLERMYKLIRPLHKMEFPDLKIKKMKSMWGSCRPGQKLITLNQHLIKAPKDCIDYVSLHELIHFKYKNHKIDFYNLLTILMPDWKDKKKILDKVIVRELYP